VNERIKLLADQAYEDFQTPTSPKYLVFNKEKFAELIVQECLDIVNRHEYSYHEADPLWETAQLIKEHFGIER
jgi:hypothetical protein